MSDTSIIVNAIQAIARTSKLGDKPDIYIATVDSVELDTRSCTCTLVSGSAGLQLTFVRLMANVDDGMLIIPAKDSTVFIQSGQNVDPYVIMYSQIDKVFYVAGNSTFQIDKDGVKLDGDNFSGIPKVIELTTKLNNLEKDINNLKSAFSSWVVAPNDGGAALKVSAATWFGSTLTLTQQADIENTKVQHGDGS